MTWPASIALGLGVFMALFALIPPTDTQRQANAALIAAAIAGVCAFLVAVLS